MKVWHFVGETLRDGRPLPADGEVLRHEGAVVPCESGLHGSVRIMDALRYAPFDSKWICRCVLGGTIVPHSDDKHAASERTILWRVEADPVLREFARRCALDVIHLWDAPDVMVRYLKTGDEAIRDAARSAAWENSAGSAAWENAARSAAWYAAIDAARSAAWENAASVAAGSAAWAAARKNAARSAAWDNAAWDAVRKTQNRRLAAMCVARRGK